MGLEVVVFLPRLVYLSRIQVGRESYLNDWKEDMNLCLLLIRAGVLLIGTAGVELVGLPSPAVAASSGGGGRQTPPPATLFRSRFWPLTQLYSVGLCTQARVNEKV